ncbi:MAG: short-chain dehydrogenase [Candidatus Parabeggiatoa sp. nov. 3]|nr:SDR family NAD(P)-dependent oxidoreductase [Candidatus Parabeggiatoa sp.]RKZ53609.1 MAG: short-chain dehydrogenase [Gammaproteobacteria bacterium]RKZ69103.1 MAG: short-chain dehydrogenase [Gammaproteobacteria bacterium]RKZ86062.1 MAG: short-chain dehydrogenase [Gammaproteobacteria bacterium]
MNKSVVITGASRGFGYALYNQFISHEWNVIPIVRKGKDAQTLKIIGGKFCFPIIADITENNVLNSINASLKSFKTIDLLINNAGIGGNSILLNDTSPDEILSLFNVHCLGVLRVSQSVLPLMKRSGIVINVSSRFGSISKTSKGELDDLSCSYAYRIAKSAQNMLTQCMCREYINSGLKICSIHPGRLKTDIASMDADKTPDEAAKILYKRLFNFEHGKFYNLFGEEMEW